MGHISTIKQTVIERVLVDYTGTTTSDGNIGATTLVDASLTVDYDGKRILIATGGAVGESGTITGDTSGGTITVTSAFSVQILQDVRFHIITDIPATVELDAIKGVGWSDENLTTMDALLDSILDDTATSGVVVDSYTATAKGEINAEVDTALNTVIPAAAAGSINERVKTLDDNYTAARAGYIDELAAANLPTDVAAVKTDTAAVLTDTADMQPKLGTPAADISADIAAVKVDTTVVLTDTANMQPKLGTPAADISADIAAVKVDTAATLVDTGTTIPGTIITLQTNVSAVLTDTADMQPKLGTPAADISADIAAAKADTAAILTDTGTTIPGTITTLQTGVSSILTDTADMQPKLGTPAADISADIAAVKVDTAAVKTQTDKLAGGESTGTHSHTSNTSWQEVVTISTTSRKKVPAIWLDFVNLTQNMNIRLRYKIDGTNLRIFWSDTWLVADDDGVLIDVPRAINNDLELDLQSAVAEGAARDIPYAIIYEDMEE